MEKTKVMFVCLGNICRSPTAQAIFQSIVDKQGLSDRFIVDSSGTSGYHDGELADARSRKVLAERGVALDHRSKKFLMSDWKECDFLIPQDASNLENMNKIKPADASAAVYLMRDFDESNKGSDVPDPWFGGEQGFYEVYDMIEECCKGLLRTITES